MRYDDTLNLDDLKRYARSMNSRAKAANRPGRVTAAMLQARILESGGRCEWCDTSIVHAEFEIDHILALSRGGNNTPDNIATACPECNRRKAGKHPAAFALETVARTGRQTALITHLAKHYEIGDTPVQASLFESPATPPSETDDTDDEIPPYRW